MNKLRSYTLMEVLVVMVMSSLVIAITYNSYMLYYQKFVSFKKRSSAVAQLSLMDRLLTYDFSKSTYVVRKENGVECIYKGKTISYRWEDLYMIRTDQAIIDTFIMNTDNLNFLFYKKKVENYKMVDELAFEDTQHGSTKHFHYLKKYGADVLINEVK